MNGQPRSEPIEKESVLNYVWEHDPMGAFATLLFITCIVGAGVSLAVHLCGGPFREVWKRWSIFWVKAFCFPYATTGKIIKLFSRLGG